MRTIHDVTAFLVLLVVHTICLVGGAYRFLTERTETTLPPAATAAPVEAATPEQPAREEDSSRPTVLARSVTVVIPWPVELYVFFGYSPRSLSLILAHNQWLRTVALQANVA